MSNIIKIENQSIAVREFKGQRVITFKDIDRVHSRPESSARQNFNRNKNRFIEGVDYFVCNSYEAQKEYGISAPNGLILLTESGYLMLVKSFNDDLAWTVQRQLVNTYFRQKQIQQHEQTTIEPPYSYTEKHFRGQQVVTIADIEHFTGITRHMIFYHFNYNRKKFIPDADYFFLEFERIAEFKKNTPCIGKLVSSLLVFTKTGVDKLAKFMNVKSSVIPCVATVPVVSLPAPQPLVKYQRPPQSDVPDNKEAQKYISEIQENVLALSKILKMANRYNEFDVQDGYFSTINSLGIEILCTCNLLKRVQYNATDKAM